MLYKTIYYSPIGQLSLIASDNGLVGIWFFHQNYFEFGITNDYCKAKNTILKATIQWLDSYFNDKTITTPPPLDVKGTSFQQRVWQQLRNIPFGQVVTYSDIAQKLGVNSCQAVGQAISKNPVAILIPCHRVIGKNGQLTGYAGGITKKEWLLTFERKNTE